MNEKMLKEKMKEYFDINEKSLEIARSIDNECEDTKFVEGYLIKLSWTYNEICTITSKPEILRTDKDKLYLEEFMVPNIQYKLDEEGFKSDCIVIINTIRTKLIRMESSKYERDEFIQLYGEKSYNFNIKLFELICDNLDSTKYDDLYNYSLYNLYLLMLLKYLPNKE